MKTNIVKKSTSLSGVLFVVILLGLLCLRCNKEEIRGGSVYSGNANFNITGDTTLTFNGRTDDFAIQIENNTEFFQLTFTNDDNLSFFLGIRDIPKIKAQVYNISDITSGGWTAIFLGTDLLFDSKSGEVKITTLNANKINGSVDLVLSAPFSFGNDLTVKGTFELKAR